MQLVRVTKADLATVEDHGSVIAITGTHGRSSKRVTFAGDRRVMEVLIQAVLNGEEPLGNVEEWQILSVGPAPASLL